MIRLQHCVKYFVDFNDDIANAYAGKQEMIAESADASDGKWRRTQRRWLQILWFWIKFWSNPAKDN
jgi:hypothetical protein